MIPSTRGFHQGDVVATLLFALLLHPVVLEIQRDVPLELNAWILDDGGLGGEERHVIQAVEIILREGPWRGLELSTEHSIPQNSKSSVWCPAVDNGNTDPLGLEVL